MDRRRRARRLKGPNVSVEYFIGSILPSPVFSKHLGRHVIKNFDPDPTPVVRQTTVYDPEDSEFRVDGVGYASTPFP